MLSFIHFLVCAILVTLCYADETISTTQEPKVLREGSVLEIAIILTGILAAATMSIIFVLVPTIIYHNYSSKKEIETSPAAIHQ